MNNQKPKPGVYMTMVDTCPMCQGKSSNRNTSLIIPDANNTSCRACGGNGLVMGLVPAHEYILQFLLHLGVPIDPDIMRALVEEQLKKTSADGLNLRDDVAIMVDKKGEA